MIKTMDSLGTIYGGLAKLLLEFYQSHDLTIPKVLQEIQQQERFDFKIWYQLLHELDQTLGIPALGLQIASQVQAKHLGMVAYLALSCKNLAEVLSHFFKFHRLIYDGSALKIQQYDDYMSIAWEKIPYQRMSQTSDEIAIALMIECLKLLKAFDKIQLHEVHFQHVAPTDYVIYEKYFRCKVKFSESETRILLNRHILELNLPQADETLQQLLEQQATHLLKQLPNSTQFDVHLKQLIGLGLTQKKFQIQYIAKQLNCSVRQLQRYLQAKDMSYQQYLQEMRLQLAQQYLQENQLTLSEIALALGYSEQSAFQRAFKKWTKLTPKAWQKALALNNA